MATAPGLSPCTQTESAAMCSVLPSMAVTTPSVASRSMRAATSAGSCSTAPASRRDSSAPSGA